MILDISIPIFIKMLLKQVGVLLELDDISINFHKHNKFKYVFTLPTPKMYRIN